MRTAVVTNAGWNVSYETGDGINGCILHVFSFSRSGPGAVMTKATCYGRLFPSLDDAKAYALEHRYLKVIRFAD